MGMSFFAVNAVLALTQRGFAAALVRINLRKVDGYRDLARLMQEASGKAA